MRIELVVEYLRELPWSASRWGASISRGLLARGHDITVLCDGADDPEEFHTLTHRAGVIVRRPLRTVRGRDPRGFVHWLERRPRHGVRLSLSRFVPGDLWLPIGPSASHDARAIISRRSPATILMDALHEPWIPAAIRQERRAANGAPSTCLLNIGGESLGFASSLNPLGTMEPAVRRGVRERLGLSDDRLVLLASAVHLGREGTREMIAGLALAAGAAPRPVLLLAGRDAWSAANLGESSGIRDLVRPIGSTSRMEALLAACDVAIAPGSAEVGATGRFIADAIRMGRPVLCDSQASGASLVQAGAGEVVREHTAEAWKIAIDRVRDQSWRALASMQAASKSNEVGMDRFAERLEGCLARLGEAGPRSAVVSDQTPTH